MEKKVSRQREWQLRKKAEGKCVICGKPAIPKVRGEGLSNFCQEDFDKQRILTREGDKMKKKESKYTETAVVAILERRGVKMGQKTADASKMNVAGIDTLGKLDFLMNYCGYTVFLPKT